MFTYGRMSIAEVGIAHILQITIIDVHIFWTFKEKKGGDMKDPNIPRTKFFTFVN